MCVNVCLCVCEQERERERERAHVYHRFGAQGGREREREALCCWFVPGTLHSVTEREKKERRRKTETEEEEIEGQRERVGCKKLTGRDSSKHLGLPLLKSPSPAVCQCITMEDYALPFWLYMGVMSVFVGGAIKKVLASHISVVPTLVAWLSATVLVERLWSFCVPAVLVLAVLCVACCFYSVRIAPLPSLPAEGKVVFITGCDSGFGKAAARNLDELGFEVFATVLDLSGEGARDLKRTCSPRLTLLQVDITEPQQVQQALLDTKAKLGHKGLWGLVNNAGVCVNFGDAELSLMSNFRGCMEINFFGTLFVTKTFLPLLRQAKGRIVTISSPAGDQPFPCLAAYGASKAALNLFTNTLRHEMEPWGVKVSTILPSSYKTGQSSNYEYWETQFKHLIQNLSPSLLEEYGEDYMEETKELFQSYAKTANEDLSPVIHTISEALLSPRPHVRYYAGPGVGLMYFIYSYFPFSISDRFLQKLFVRKKLAPRALRKENSLSLNGLKHNINNNNNNNDIEKVDK